jgi:hypothetical protein
MIVNLRAYDPAKKGCLTYALNDIIRISPVGIAQQAFSTLLLLVNW